MRRWLCLPFLLLLFVSPWIQLECAVTVALENHQDDDDDNANVCLDVPMTMVLQDCAVGPFGLADVLRHELYNVFGVSYMCYSLRFGYLTYADLQQYKLLYIDASGSDFDTVTDWFLYGGGGGNKNDDDEPNNVLLPEFQRHQHAVLWNAAPIQMPARNNVSRLYPFPLTAGITLHAHRNNDFLSETNTNATAAAAAAAAVEWLSPFAAVEPFKDDDLSFQQPPWIATHLVVAPKDDESSSSSSLFEPILYTTDFEFPTETNTFRQQRHAVLVMHNQVLLAALTPAQMQRLRKPLLQYLCNQLDEQKQQPLVEEESSSGRQRKHEHLRQTLLSFIALSS